MFIFQNNNILLSKNYIPDWPRGYGLFNLKNPILGRGSNKYRKNA